MTPFAYHRPDSIAGVLAALAATPGAALLAGGTCLIDLMKQGVARPEAVIDLGRAEALSRVEILPTGALSIGATAVLGEIARRADVRIHWPLLHAAILAGLTPQLRNTATCAGNIMQRPRCIYFREPGFACNKRAPGTGCAARAGVHYAHAIFGGARAASCIAVHPSDLCVALTALNATLRIAGSRGHTRSLALAALHRLPGADASRETTLDPDELILAIDIPPQYAPGFAYAKGPQEGFALVSCAALLACDADRITRATLVLGGVAHKPWRLPSAEAALLGRHAGRDAFDQAIDAAMEDAETDAQTAFRLPLLRGVMRAALTAAAARAGAAA